jgi:serine/threonine protein kinase
VNDAAVRDKLARISGRPEGEWDRRVELEFPGDPALRVQALLWLHADKEGPEIEGAPPSLGDTADERYELTLRLDTGASSSVWQAFDRRLGRSVAIKVFHSHGESEAMEQVLAEARAASDVISEHVVRVLDVQVGDGHPYIVMELVSEYDVDKADVVLGATAASTPPRDIDEVVRWAMQAARGVHEAHLRNVFHRDLKPRNVLITPHSRRARVADFGLAVSGASPDASHPSITLLKRGPSGPVSVRGTPEYMAPEQARGLPLTLDARAAKDRGALVAIDVWGIGAIAYDLLGGKPPWLARRADDLSAWEIAASTERPSALERTPSGERIPRRLRRIIEKAMSTDPALRYPSAAALANELQAFLERRPTSQDRSRALRVVLWIRRNPQLALTVLLVLLLTGWAVGARARVSDLRDQRDALDAAVAAQKAEQAMLDRTVEQARTKLAVTQGKLRTERDNLAALESSVAEERATYQSVLEAKEQALREATSATRKLLEQLEAARRDIRSAEAGRTAVEKQLAEARREADKASRDRERFRKEREAARAERDALQRERDAAIADREAAERKLRDAERTKRARGSPP